MKITVNSSVENGKLKRNRKLITETIEQFEGKEIQITFERKRKKRSNNQNAYYHAVIVPLIQLAFKEEWGERLTREEVHEFLKLRFNYVEKVNKETGEILNLPKSTKQNTTVEQEEYHDDCRRFALEWFNVVIPLPNEQTELEIS